MEECSLQKKSVGQLKLEIITKIIRRFIMATLYELTGQFAELLEMIESRRNGS